MKKYLFLLLCTAPAASMAQQTLTNGLIKAKIEVTSENNGGDGPMIQIAGNETDIVAYVKDSMRKVVVKSNTMNSITLYDGKTGTSTILMETMGEKTGYTQNETQRAEQRRRADSISKAREGEESGGGSRVLRIGGGATDKTLDITYTDETKTINNINCKKAVITTQNAEGVQKKTDVWYTPDYTLPAGVAITRGTMNLNSLKGLPVMYQSANTISIGNSEMTLTTHYEIKSIETAKAIEDKEFEVPKGYKIKTWEEFLKDNPEGVPPRRTTIRMGN